MQFAGTTLNLKRAIMSFLVAYVAITILGTALSFAIAAVLHTPSTIEPMQNQAYLASEPFLPWLNLIVWMAGSWMYFRSSSQGVIRRQAWALGLFWLVVALPLDLIAFVLIKTPISLSPYDYYVSQFPWIYLIYVAVLISPLCYMVLCRWFGIRQPATR